MDYLNNDKNRIVIMNRKNQACFIRRKLGSKCGESITETLVAVLVMSLVFVVFSGSVVTSAKINKKAEDMVTAIDMDEGITQKKDTSVTIQRADNTPNSDGVYEVDSSATKFSADASLSIEKHKRGPSDVTDNFCYYELK